MLREFRTRRNENPAGAEPAGLVLNIMRFCVHDGPGIRTTVFLKGCPLRCAWCHNPEGQGFEPALLFFEERCRHCGDCARVCPQGLIPAAGGSPRDRRLCQNCGTCVEACVAGAREIAGRRMTVGEALAEIERDVVCFDQSGGGVTLSGGEPLSQPAFSVALLTACREHGIHTVLETCGYAGRETMLRVAAQADLVLFDLKLLDPVRHKHYTGVSNEPILGNLEALAAEGVDVVIRVPLVPGVNDDPAEINEMARFVSRLGLRRLDLLPYHRLGLQKYRRLGVPCEFSGISEPSAEQIRQAAGRFQESGLFVRIGG